MNYRDFLQKVIYAIINPLIKAMIAVGITPNIVTFVGFLGNIVAAGFFLDAAWMLGTEQADYASCMVTVGRSEERRVGKECRSRWSPYH